MMSRRAYGHDSVFRFLLCGVLLGPITTNIMNTTMAAALDPSTTATMNAAVRPYHVPTISLSELVTLPTTTLSLSSSSSSWSVLSSALSTTGLLAVTLEDDQHQPQQQHHHYPSSSAVPAWELEHFRAQALTGLCHCTRHHAEPFLLSMAGTDAFVLTDDDAATTTSTKRTTLATATMGWSHPLPLPDGLADVCGLETAQAMETLREIVSEVSSAFVQALDHHLLLPPSPQMKYREYDHHHPSTAPAAVLLETSQGGSYSSVRSIVEAATNLEHFHVYDRSPAAATVTAATKKDEVNEDDHTVLGWHTDAGLFLAFVPGLACPDEEQDGTNDSLTNHENLYVHVPGGGTQRAIFPPRSIGIMLGLGAEQWLKQQQEHVQQQQQLRATRHAVKMEPGTRRAWYGMMHLVPANAIVQEVPTRATFADMRQAMVLSSHQVPKFGDDAENSPDHVSIGCGTSSAAERLNQSISLTLSSPLTTAQLSSSRRQQRRRLQMVADGSACNNVTNFFCWMSCLDIPDAANAKNHLDSGDSLYCLDPGVLNSKSSVANAEQQCESATGVPGGAMSSACVGLWQPTADGVPSQTVIVNQTDTSSSSSSSSDAPFCYGGTSMFMDGFHWSDTTCVIYLFPTWILSSASSLVGACILTFLFGMALEGVITYRRVLVYRLDHGWMRLITSTVMYGLQLTMGYLIMLVVMTYSGPLFMSVILGLMGGHFFSNMQSAVYARLPASEDRVKVDTTGDAVEAASAADGTVEECGCTAMPSSRRPERDTVINVPEGITPCCQNDLEMD